MIQKGRQSERYKREFGMVFLNKNKNVFCLLLILLITYQDNNAILLPQQNMHEARIPLYIEENDAQITRQEQKDWTFFVYIAADNDLRGFAARNIKQMATIGSNQHINIVIHLDIRIAGNKKITRRYYIEKDRIIHLNANDPLTQRMDSGSPQTLVSFCNWGIANYPARNYALVLWNHGTGIIDPGVGKIINPSNFFRINTITNKWELDRTIGFLDFIINLNQNRGVCWDDSTGNFLTNQTLDMALNEICSTSLHGGKFAIIGFDACLMSMLEIANIVKKYAHIMIGSQEVEMGTGWKYDKVLHPFIHGSIDRVSFAQHIVTAYEQTYSKITDDFTLSAIDTDNIAELENNVSDVARYLRKALKIQHVATVKNAIKASRSKLLCTHFDEPSYIDLHHFYINLKSSLKHCEFTNNQRGSEIIIELNKLLEQGITRIKELVLSNTVGINLNQACGISIYFPENKIHGSYRKTLFSQGNKWYKLLTDCLG